MKHTVDKNYFPGWTRKAVTFTIDDGNLPMDEKFLSYVRPAGIRGTFNLCSERLSRMTDEEYRAFYDGYGIANHCKYHPFCMWDGEEYTFADAPFDEATADPSLLYPHPSIKGLFYRSSARGWRKICSPEDYIRFFEESRQELEAVFGYGSVPSSVIPFSRPVSARFEEWAESGRTRSIRGFVGGGAECVDDFSLPKDRLRWSYNARHNNIATQAQRFEEHPDDGNLHWLCFGVHSIDYETGGNWDDLGSACDRLGNRPETYFSAPVDTVFDYEDAIARLSVTDDAIENPTDLDLFVTVDGVRRTVCRHSTLPL